MIKQNIPRVRFIGFNDEWKKDIIDNISERFDNLRVPITASNRVEGTTPYYGANGIQDYVEGYTHNGEYLLVAEDGASDLKNYPVQYVNGKVWVNNHAHVLSGKQEKISNLFFKSRLQILNFEKYLVGGSRAKLNADILMRMPVDFPKLPEQTRIGSLFSTIDSLLSSYKDNLENYQAFKKSMLSKMFPKAGQTVPEIRLDGFEGKWERAKLNDKVDFFDEKRIPIDSKDRKAGIYPYYGASGIIDYVENYIFDGEFVLLAEDGANITMRNSPIAYLTTGKFWLNNHAHIMKIKNGSNKFLLQLLEKQNYVKYNTGTAQPKLNGEVVRKMVLDFPNRHEQQAIGSFFSNLDDLISSYQTKVDELETLKKKLLQDMFI